MNILFSNLRHPGHLFAGVIRRLWFLFPNDKLYLKLIYFFEFGHFLDLKNPQTFSEKIQWLKLYDRKPEYTQLVDKISAKEYVSKIIGEEYVVPLLGVWENFDDIDFESLPDKFVLKSNQGSAGSGMVICRNKAKLDYDSARRNLEKSMKSNCYPQYREWPYKNIKPRIFAEHLLESGCEFLNEKKHPDFKWYCFYGEPKYCQVLQDRSTKEFMDFYDTEWIHQDFIGLNPVVHRAAVPPTHANNLSKHLEIARQLSNGMSFSRIELYETGEKTYFGVISSYPLSGMGSSQPEEYNEILDKMITLPGENRGGVIIRLKDNGEFEVSHPDLLDYKFFCFNGEPKYCQVISGRSETMCIDFFDMEWKHQPFHEPRQFHFAEKEPKKPSGFEKMCEIAKQLAQGKVFVRIDFYQINGRVYFGEITFYPTSGMGGFSPSEWDITFGKMITI